ncbi:MFS transporter [Candidimonas nitroreducens]|uniref:MFS transporter n=1 Tax=Candidimonas nitroreducens TaxID=683354 RepID=A0A225N068_9BURK|nr:MFS transporter [Candidimonas nitroreducens]OWT65450.1 MFS transporter [Candidimonas nitroreducens]
MKFDPLYKVSFLVVCFGVLFGFGITSIAGVLDTLKQVFQLSIYGEQGLVAVLILACFAGAVLAGPLTRRRGRRPALLLCAVLALAGYAIIWGGPDLGWFVAARVLIGLSVGLSSMVVPMYASETTPAARRGGVVALFQLAVTAGILIAYSVALAFAPDLHWSLVLACGLLPAVLATLGTLLLPESPRWLAARGRSQEAREAGRRLQLLDEVGQGEPIAAAAGAAHGAGTAAAAVRAADTDAANAAAGSTGSRTDRDSHLRRGSTMPVLILCSVLFVLQNLSGIDGILYYAPRIFETLGFAAGTAALAATFGLGLVNFLATMVALYAVDRAGRRPLLIGGSAAMVLGLAAVVAAASWGWAWTGLCGLAVFIIAFAISLGPLPYVLMAELFPSAIREQGIAAASAVSWIFNALVAFTFLTVVQAIGLPATIGIFALACLLSLAVCMVFLPETRRMSLETIEANVLAGLPLRRLGAAAPGSPPDPAAGTRPAPGGKDKKQWQI